MKLFVALIFGVLALTKADVSHLTNKYLPPLQQSFSSPSVTYTTSQVQPVNEYLPPVSQPSYASATFTQAVPATVDTTYTATGHSVPSLVSLSSPSFQQTYSSPSVDYLPPVQQTYSVPAVQQTYSVPTVQQTYSVPSVQTTYTDTTVHSGPSYSLSGSASGFSGSSTSLGGGNDLSGGTQYSSNGGYVYRRK